MKQKRKLGELLLEANVVTEAQIDAALGEQRKWGGRLGRTLVEMGFANEATICQALAQQLSLPAVDLDTAVLPARIESSLRLDLAERYGVFPVSFDARSNQLGLATADPTNHEAIQEIEFATGHRVVTLVAAESAIDRAIRRHYFGETPTRPTGQAPQLATETLYELDALLGGAGDAVGPPASAPAPRAAPLRDESPGAELVGLRQHVANLGRMVALQSRALNALVELLVEYGLVAREDYLKKVDPSL